MSEFVDKFKRILARIFISISGPVIFSLANFVAAILLQQLTNATSFGLYAFGHVVIATGLGISNGLFGSPLVVALQHNGNDGEMIGGFSRVNIVYCFMGAVAVFVLLRLSGLDVRASGLFALLAGLFWMRWFLRSLELARLSRVAPAMSDVIYGLASLSFMGVVVVFLEISVVNILLAQILACLLAYIPLFAALTKTMILARNTSVKKFWLMFKSYGGWSLGGVVSVDVTASAHAYIITLIAGPAAFAPIAAITLFLRPMSLILTALIQFERPIMAVAIRNKSRILLKKSIQFIQYIVGGAWLVNVLLLAGLFYFSPGLLTRGVYDFNTLIYAAILLSGILLARGMREPLAAALQAEGDFKYVTQVTIVAAFLVIIIVLGMVFLLPSMPVLSLLGTLAGEIIIIYFVVKHQKIALKKIDFGE